MLTQNTGYLVVYTADLIVVVLFRKTAWFLLNHGNVMVLDL
jgi:hypothetical protein